MSANSSVNIASVVKEIVWNVVEVTASQTAANTKIGVGWHQGHEHVEGELRVISEIEHVLYASGATLASISGQKYLNPGFDNDLMRYFVIQLTDHANNENFYTAFADPIHTVSGTASTVLWSNQRGEAMDYDTSYFRYPFKATFVMQSGVHKKT